MIEPVSADGSEAVERQVESFIARFTPEIAGCARACRAALRARLPAATELVYDNYQALAIGYASSERVSDCVVALAIYPKSVALSFYYGAALADPDRVLQGSGNQNRFVRLEGPQTLADPAVERLIAAALAHARLPLPSLGGGKTIVKSISARQRPRRPAAKEPA